MPSLDVKIDASDLQAWAEKLSGGEIAKAVRNGLNSASGKARTVAVSEIAKDLNVAKATVLRSVDKQVRKATLTDLRSWWTARKQRINILRVKGASVVKGVGLKASSFVLTGGGSSRFELKRAFVASGKGGNTLVFFRTGRGRFPLKAVYASHPASALGQADGASQKIWNQTANRLLPEEIGKRLQQALDRQTVAAESIPSD